jgi:hypothetical protein
MKEPGKVLISIGWVLIVLSALAFIGIISKPNHKDPSIEAFLKHPDSLSLAGTIGFIIGLNILLLFALGFGIYASIKKNRKGKPLIIISIIALLIISGTQLALPSPESATAKQFTPTLITIPQSEFEVTFPHPVERKTVTSGGIETIAYESQECFANPYLRAEFIKNINALYVGGNLQNLLDNYAKLAGLTNPEFTRSQDNIGIIGTYSGIKIVGNHNIKLYGKLVIGKFSALNCLICENLEDFPSEDTVTFMASVKRK